MKNKKVAIIWIITVILVAITFNIKTIAEDGLLDIFVSLFTIAFISIIVGLLFSFTKTGEDRTKNIFLVASIFNFLMTIGSAYSQLTH